MQSTEKVKLKEPLWERQEKETSFAYTLFLKYKDEKMNCLGNLVSLALKLGRSKKYAHSLQVYSCVFSWKERLDAYIDHLNKIELEEQEKARRDMVRRQADNGVAFQTKAMEMLANLTQNLDADDVCRLIETGVKMERIARGAPSEITTVAPPERIETREERMARLHKQLEDING